MGGEDDGGGRRKRREEEETKYKFKKWMIIVVMLKKKMKKKNENEKMRRIHQKVRIYLQGCFRGLPAMHDVITVINTSSNSFKYKLILKNLRAWRADSAPSASCLKSCPRILRNSSLPFVAGQVVQFFIKPHLKEEGRIG